MRRTDRVALWTVAGLTLLAFGLRLYRIDADSIWWDEGISLSLARGTWAALLTNRASNLHPPLYFMLLKLWVSVVGNSVLAARSLSLLAGLPVGPLAYDAARRGWGRTVGLVAALLAAAAAVFLTYAQEVRVYALLPVMTLLLLAMAARLARQPGRRGLWAALAMVEAASFLLHYLSAITIVYVNLRLVLGLWRGRRVVWRAWLASQVGAFLLILPWLGLVAAHLADVRSQFVLGSSLATSPASLPEVVSLVWTFLLTGHDRARFVTPLPTLAGALGIGLAAGMVWLLLARSDERRALAWSALDWLLPVVAATSLWVLRPLSHPRYTLAWAGALWVWIGIVVGKLATSRAWSKRIVGLAGLIAALILSGLSARAYLFDPLLGKQDVRGVAALLRERAEPGDVALVPWQDESLSYYDTGPARVSMIDFTDPDAAWVALAQATEGAGRVFVMEYEHATRDPQGITTYALERAGALEEVVSLRGLEVFVYRLGGPVAPPELAAVDIDLNGVRMVGLRVDPAPADEAVTVALAWQGGDTEEALKATVQLRDSLGNTVALDDRVLLDALQTTTDGWPPGSVIVNAYVLPLPEGTPPVTYDVAAALYPASETDIGDLRHIARVALLPPTGAPGDPYDVGDLGLDPSVGGELGHGLRLTGALYFPRDVRPGDAIDVTLRWQAEDLLPDLEPALRLAAGDAMVIDRPARPANGQYPMDSWSPGETVLDRRRLTVPADAPPGALVLSVGLGAREVEVGEVWVIGGSLARPPEPRFPADAQFADVARLVGYDLSGDVMSEEGLSVTLYWQAIGPLETDYTVFVHLIDSAGVLVAQHDYPPVGGARPTSGWRAGETIADVHGFGLAEGVTPTPGEAHLSVGLYDPETLDRVALPGGEDAFILDATIRLP